MVLLPKHLLPRKLDDSNEFVGFREIIANINKFIGTILKDYKSKLVYIKTAIKYRKDKPATAEAMERRIRDLYATIGHRVSAEKLVVRIGKPLRDDLLGVDCCVRLF
ncbi:Protein of unknown function [Pyronema omphalodes CBS 100304]|uniref:Uncharacterized protein n=1 Tax=Pyronema omphalodes (strain CBS 100304) TaxID=1076935 RepID=U4LB91_PYROM|nr:Protein of unknown function [Pyronema omphalodes CBS 100304]